MIIPSIDLMNGKAVQLRQGREKVLERENVLNLAKEFRKYGEIAVIDLDAALGKGDNMKLIKQLCRIADCRVGGGIRTVEKANNMLAAGAKKIIIGTKATSEFLKQLPKDRLIAAIDTEGDEIVDKGWTNKTGKNVEEKIKEIEKYCSEFLFTNVNVEGLMKGTDIDKVKEIKNLTKNKLTVAGGITTIDEIRELEAMNCNSQLGMAVYTGKLSLSEAFISVLDFKKNSNLVPTIVQDDTGQVLMLANSTRESLKRTFATNKATYYSRSRERLWTKGEESGNLQKFIKARYDCDRDTLLFTVKQKNVACHTGSYSCFGNKEFGLQELYEVLRDRIENPRQNSYTSKIAKDEKKIMEKIREEAEEVINYKDKNNLVWELADLTYFLTVLMAKKGITPQDVKNELWRRRK